MLKIYYEDTDLTGYATVRSCLARDAAGERCDALEVEFDDAPRWDAWGVQEDERIRATLDGFDSGTLYVHSVLPEHGHYRVYATALPCRARRALWRSYRGRTLAEIAESAAAAGGMGWALYGVEGRTAIPYIQQEGESCAAFLSRLLRLEGAALKCVNGKYAGIGLWWAQAREAERTLRLTAGQEGTSYRRGGEKLRGLRVRTPAADASAEDTAAASWMRTETVGAVPALEAAQAGRWARALLLDRNRRCESLRVQSEFDGALTALLRMDVTGGTAADGAWLVERVEHDLVNRRSDALLHRCIDTIV